MSKYLFVNGKEIHKFKAKDSEIAPNKLRLGNISKDWSVDLKKTGLYGNVYDFSVDYPSVPVVVISHIHKYLMIENGIV